MIRVVLHAQRLSIAVRIDKRRGDKVLLCINASVVTKCERPVPRLMVDGPPEIDDLETVLQELRCIAGGQMKVNASDGRVSRLVNMDLGNRLTLLRAVVNLSRAPPADSYLPLNVNDTTTGLNSKR
jgi:hypothetical protein